MATVHDVIRRLGLAVAVSLLVACSSSAPAERPDDQHGVDEPTTLDVFELRKHDCFTRPEEEPPELQEVDAVPCDTPFDLQVFSVVTSDADAYPGEATLSDDAEAACIDDFAEATGLDYLDSQLFVTFLLPTLQSWSDDKSDREIVCLLTDPSGPLTASELCPETKEDEERAPAHVRERC